MSEHRTQRRARFWLAVGGVSVAATVLPVPARSEAAPILPPGNGAIIAIVIDDTVDGARLDEFLTLGAPITYAVFPFQRRSAVASGKIKAAGAEAIIHLPIDGRPTKPGGWYLGVRWKQREVDEWVDRAFRSVPDAVGANNHRGSTWNIRAMRQLMRRLYQRNLFFMDSWTVFNTVAYAAAVEQGMPSRINNLFLDYRADVDYTERRLYKLAAIAKRYGSAIGIGHLQRRSTYLALKRAIPVLLANGYRILPLSQVTNRPYTSSVRRRLTPPFPTTTTSTTTTTPTSSTPTATAAAPVVTAGNPG